MNKEASATAIDEPFSMAPIYILGTLIVITLCALIWFLINQHKTVAAELLEYTLKG